MSESLFYVAACPFEAARYVDILPEEHRSRRLHGHSFVARVRSSLAEDWAHFPGAEAADLKERLAAAVDELDYSSLNDRIAVPTDENLARWVRQQVDLPGASVVGVQSTAHQGADLDDNGDAHIWRRFRFEAAHQLPNVPEDHQCGRMHGHGFEVILHGNQSLNGDEMGVDFDKLGEIWAPLHEQLHMSCLNDIEGLENPTSEVLAAWLWDRISPALEELSWVTVYETTTAGCHYDGDHYRIWKEFRFESALKLKEAPESDARRKLHGHSYLCRLHLSAPLDAVMGWTVDYGDVKQLFKPAYGRLDHHYLNELEELDAPDIGGILKWIRAQLEPVLPSLDRIDLYETPGCGGTLAWGEHSPALPV